MYVFIFLQDEVKFECDTEETTTHTNHHQLCVFDKSFDAEKRKLDDEKYENVPKCIDDSWVKFSTNESLKSSIKNQPFVEKRQAIAVESQKVL